MGTLTAVVIGSGFGGAVTACRLAQAAEVLKKQGGEQLKVIVLERGRRYGKDDFPRLQLPQAMTSDEALRSSVRLPDFARFSWRNDYGLFDVKNLGQLLVLQSAGLGGGSLIYGNVLLRAPDHILKDWPAPYKPAALKPYYSLAEYMLGAAVSKIPYEKTTQLERGAKARGLPVMKLPLAINFAEGGQNRFGREQGQCNGCGDCIIGCSLHAKNTLDLNYLALAETCGAEIFTLTEVKRIAPSAGGKFCVRHVRHDQGEAEELLIADFVFLAAGAVGSTDLLMRSAKTETEPGLDLGKRVGASVFANGDALGVVFDTAEPGTPWSGPTITRSIVHREAMVPPAPPKKAEPAKLSEPEPNDWFLIQDGGIPPSLKRALGYFHSGMWFGRNRFGPAEKPRKAGTPKLGPLTDLFMDLPLLFSAFTRNPHQPDTAFDKAWQRYIPKDLWPIADVLTNPEGRFRREVAKVDEDVLGRLQVEVGRRFGLASWFPRLKKVIDREVMLDSVIAALRSRYDVLGYIPKAAGLLETVVAAAQYLLLGHGPTPNSAVLLAMGPDHEWLLKRKDDRLRATRAHPRAQSRDDIVRYGAQERVMRDLTHAFGGELRTNPGWAIGRRAVTVHTQGGCGMPPAEAEAAPYVSHPDGHIGGYDNLYVMDASAFPSSVGVNPSLTITAVAEWKIEEFISTRFAEAREAFLEMRDTELHRNEDGTCVRRPRPPSIVDGNQDLLVDTILSRVARPTDRKAVGIRWSEWLTGTLSVRPKPATAEDVPVALSEAAAREGLASDCHLEVELKAEIPNLDYWGLEPAPTVFISGRLKLKGPSGTRIEIECEGELKLVLKNGNLFRMRYDLHKVGDKTATVLKGSKYFKDDPGIDSFLDATTLFTYFSTGTEDYLGVIRVPLPTFIGKQLPTFEVTGAEDLNSSGKIWALARFGKLFFGSMADVYLPELFFRGHKG